MGTRVRLDRLGASVRTSARCSAFGASSLEDLLCQRFLLHRACAKVWRGIAIIRYYQLRVTSINAMKGKSHVDKRVSTVIFAQSADFWRCGDSRRRCITRAQWRTGNRAAILDSRGCSEAGGGGFERLYRYQTRVARNRSRARPGPCKANDVARDGFQRCRIYSRLWPRRHESICANGPRFRLYPSNFLNPSSPRS